MTFPRPTLAELARRAETELQIDTDSDALRRNLFTPTARAAAGAVHGLYGHQVWIAQQIHPQSCDDDTLEEVHAPIWLNEGRKPATTAAGKIRLTGSAGAEIEQGTVWTRADGLEYTNPVGYIMPATSMLDIDVVCTTPGQAGSTDADTELTLVNPAEGIDGKAVVIAPGLTGGADVESYDDLRERVLQVRRNGGQVGKTADWETWALEVAGVTRAWAAPRLIGPGTITVFFVRDDDADIFPDSQETAAVQSHLEATGTPFGQIFAVGPKRKLIDISLRVSPDTPEVRAAVTEALRNTIAKAAHPVRRDSNGHTVIPLSGVLIYRSHLTEAISGATGENDHMLAVPDGNVQCAIGDLAELGAVTWLP